VASAKAHAAASKALELDPTIAEGHAELGLVEFYYDLDWPRSEQEFRGAIELNPNYATAHQWYGYYLAAMGRFPEALEEARKAQQIDPLSLSINTTLAGRYRDLHQYAQAIDLNRRTLEMDPTFVPAHIALGAAYEDQGILWQAVSEYQKAVDLSPNNPIALASLARLCIRAFGRSSRSPQNDSPSAGGIQTPLRVCFRYGDGLCRRRRLRHRFPVAGESVCPAGKSKWHF
jgi:tetratricopeptide (TPR) repeat protein